MLEIKNSFNLVKTSYKADDVTILLKDLTTNMRELSTREREEAIQSGVHYSTMLPEEKAPSDEYMELYKKSTRPECLRHIANLVGVLAEMIYKSTSTDKVPVLISLARAGIPVGILLKRRLKEHYNLDCSHYAISIIRDKGIDTNAMNFIYDREVLFNSNSVENFFFIDGWTGKGAIKTQLEDAVEQLKKIDDKWLNLSSNLYVLADPANITDFCGTKEDCLLPSACLNSTVSGLISRTILNSYINIDNGEFHGAAYFKKFENIDVSNEFIDSVSEYFNDDTSVVNSIDKENETGLEVVKKIAEKFNISDTKKIKPGIGETTRVLLRRVPWKVLINNSTSMKDEDIQHILLLCKEKGISIEKYDLGHYYKVCGIIKELSADA